MRRRRWETLVNFSVPDTSSKDVISLATGGLLNSGKFFLFRVTEDLGFFAHQVLFNRTPGTAPCLLPQWFSLLSAQCHAYLRGTSPYLGPLGKGYANVKS